jgi:hypothetical protein
MATTDFGTRDIRLAARRGARVARPWVATLARAGYAAKGVLYATIGGLAAMAAFGTSGGKATDSEGALREIAGQPFGSGLLLAMIIGLSGHALWRLIQGVFDPEYEARSAKSPAIQRASFLARGLLHVGLVIFAVKLLLGEHQAQGDGARSLSADLMSWHPLGVALVGLIGAAIVVFAIGQLIKAWSHDLLEKLDHRMSARERRVATLLARFGTAARGLVFGLIGVFFLVAAVEHDPAEAKGLGGALQSLRGSDLGAPIFAAVALGLIAYGISQLVVARFRRISVA